MHRWVFGVWDCVLTEEDATYIQKYQDHGWWSKIMTPTIEECRVIQRAKWLARYDPSKDNS